MHTNINKTNTFKRQVVFRISADDWPLLETAAAKHGSIQAAILAGLHALAAKGASRDESAHRVTAKEPTRHAPASVATDRPRSGDPNDEIRTREAAIILGVKPSTVSSYIRGGRLPGRYDDTLGRSGWVTTRGALNAYKKRIGKR